MVPDRRSGASVSGRGVEELDDDDDMAAAAADADGRGRWRWRWRANGLAIASRSQLAPTRQPPPFAQANDSDRRVVNQQRSQQHRRERERETDGL